jgi:antitoxin VapB
MSTAKLFWTGSSQAVRLPKEFRFEGAEVRIRRHGNSVVLDAVPKDWSWLDRLGDFEADAADAALEPVADQQRPGLDDLFAAKP